MYAGHDIAIRNDVVQSVTFTKRAPESEGEQDRAEESHPSQDLRKH